jgi:hypothetical protein
MYHYHFFVLMLAGITSLPLVGARNTLHIVNNTPFTIVVTAHIENSDRSITAQPVAPKLETTVSIEEYRIDKNTLRIIDARGKELMTKTFSTAFEYPRDFIVTAAVVNPEKLLASPETVETEFSITITQQTGTGRERGTEKVITLEPTFTLERPVRLLVVNNTPYTATVTTLTDIRGIIKKTNPIKAYGEQTMEYANSPYPIEGFTINLFAQTMQTPCLVASVSKLSSKGTIGPVGIRPSLLMIIRQTDGSITVHQAITTPWMPKGRAEILKEWIYKDYEILSKAYKRTTPMCEKA